MRRSDGLAACLGPDGQHCRRVQETVTIEQRRVRAWGDVCVAPGGGWALSPLARR
jgi:surface antigen